MIARSQNSIRTLIKLRFRYRTSMHFGEEFLRFA
jgi:hypothetical protein